MAHRKHYIAAISAFVIWGFFPIPLRALKDYSAGEILYFRILVSAAILLFIVLGFRRKDLKKDWTFFKGLGKTQRNRVGMLTLSGGVLLTINWLTFIYIVNHISIKTASFSYLICPVVTAVLGFVLIREKITALQWMAVSLCALSCIIMGTSSLTDLGFSFLTAFSYALYLITQRKNQGFDRIIILGIQVLFACVFLNIFFHPLLNELPTSTEFYWIIFIIALIFTVIPLFLNLFALNKINAATIGILMYINPLINFIIAFVVFDEHINYVELLGYIVIFIALIVFNYQNIRRLTVSKQIQY